MVPKLFITRRIPSRYPKCKFQNIWTVIRTLQLMTQGAHMWHHNPNFSHDRASVCTFLPFCSCILDSKTGEYYPRGLTAAVIFLGYALSLTLHWVFRNRIKKKTKCASMLGPFWNQTTMKCHNSLTLNATSFTDKRGVYQKIEGGQTTCKKCAR